MMQLSDLLSDHKILRVLLAAAILVSLVLLTLWCLKQLVTLSYQLVFWLWSLVLLKSFTFTIVTIGLVVHGIDRGLTGWFWVIPIVFAKVSFNSWREYTELQTPCKTCSARGKIKDAHGNCRHCVRKFYDSLNRLKAAKQEASRLSKEHRKHVKLRYTKCLEKLQQKTGEQFEGIIGEIFRREGFLVKTTKRTGDGGIDLFIEKDGEVDIIQCKRWSAKVSVDAIQSFYGSFQDLKEKKSHNLKRAYFFTTTGYTKGAQSFCTGKPIKLIDGKEILKRILSVQHDDYDPEDVQFQCLAADCSSVIKPSGIEKQNLICEKWQQQIYWDPIRGHVQKLNSKGEQEQFDAYQKDKSERLHQVGGEWRPRRRRKRRRN